MDLNQEIRSLFATSRPSAAVPISNLGYFFPAWVIRLDNEYGVALPVSEEIQISERFSSARIRTAQMQINQTPYTLLMLTCQDEELRLEFAAICAQFVDPGINGSERKRITEAPVEWWQSWRDLLGNSIKEKSPYAVLGELLTVLNLMENGGDPNWVGGNGGVNDIICGKCEYEVKSTTMRYDNIVSVTGQFQLKHTGTETLWLVFCRFEETSNGVSIDDIVTQLLKRGYNDRLLEKTLSKLGFEAGCLDRKRKYSLIERRKYIVDENFPCITPASFTGGGMPPAIIQITYRVDLTGLIYETWGV